MRRVLDALAPPDLRTVLRMAGAGRDFALGALLAVLSAWGIVAGPWLSQPLVRVDRPIVPNGKESL